MAFSYYIARHLKKITMNRTIKKLLFFATGFFLVTGTYIYSQQISGNIQDEDSNPIPGVTVVVDGTSIGTTSDFDGNLPSMRQRR